MGESKEQLHYQEQADHILEEDDIERFKREFDHNRKKNIQKEIKEAEEAKQREQSGGVRAADEQNVDQLIGGDGAAELLAPNAARTADGLIIPMQMRNYQEREIMKGFIKLRKYNRMDIFWGKFKDVERDLVYLNCFVLGMMLLIIFFILIQTSHQ